MKIKTWTLEELYNRHLNSLKSLYRVTKCHNFEVIPLNEISKNESTYKVKPFRPKTGFALSITNIKMDMGIWEFMQVFKISIDKLYSFEWLALNIAQPKYILGFWYDQETKTTNIECTLYFNKDTKRVRQLINRLKLRFDQKTIWDFKNQKEVEIL